MPEEVITTFACGPSTPTCVCRCPDGCEHQFDGQVNIVQDGKVVGASRACAVCGMTAMEHDLWVMP
jgi:hypothetical protein